MKYYDWTGYVTKLCAETNDFSHIDDPLYPYETESDWKDVIRNFYSELELPEWFKLENRAEHMLNEFSRRPFSEIRKYFEIVPIVQNKSDKVTIENSNFTIEPEKRFIYNETIWTSNNNKYSTFSFMFFVDFDLRVRNDKVRECIFNIISKNQIYPFNVTTTLSDDHYEYYSFKARIFKYRYQKIPIIRKLTGIQKPGNNIIGMELFYKMHLYEKDGKCNSLSLCR